MPVDPFARLLQGMLPYHNHFRMEHAQIAKGLQRSQSAPKVTLIRLMQQALQLCHHLEMHHTIEEAHIFPLLADKVPSFAHNSAHIAEHAAMHAKLEELEAYASKVMQDLRSAPGKRAEADGSGQPLGRSSDADSDEDEVTKRKPWPAAVYDEERFAGLVKDVAAKLFPHLEAEESSLKPDNLKKHGLTLKELARIPM